MSIMNESNSGLPREWVDFPMTAYPVEPWTPRPEGVRVLVTGAAGAIGKGIADNLSDDFTLTGLDAQENNHPGWAKTVIGDFSDRELLDSLIADAEYVIHLATGIYAGWQGLLNVEGTGTRNLMASAYRHGVRRVVVASATHSTGWYERDAIAGQDVDLVSPVAPVRPDGLYGAAKAFSEAISRFASDWTGLPVSILKIGTMRYGSTKEDLRESDELPYLGFGEFRRDRLDRSWLTHEDMAKMLLEEFGAEETFRQRFATSAPKRTFWDHQVHTG